MGSGPLAERLHSLEWLDLSDLRRSWTAATDTPPPKVRAGLLRLALGHRWQSKELGGLSPADERRLLALASDREVSKQARPSTRLVRKWQGRTHVVTVGEDGAVLWNDRSWRSLSEVARAITGTRWSGPAFFGLEPRQKKEPERSAAAAQQQRRRAARRRHEQGPLCRLHAQVE